MKTKTVFLSLASVGLAVAAAFAVGPLLSGDAPPPAQQPAPTPVAEDRPTPAGPSASVPPPKADTASAAPRVQTRIAPGTPAQYLVPYLLGYTPVEILADGTQIYDDIPYRVRQPDGTMKEVRCRMTLQPTTPRPVLPEHLEAPTKLK